MVPILSVTFTYRFEAPAIFVFIITPPSGAPAYMSWVGVDCESGGGGDDNYEDGRSFEAVSESDREDGDHDSCSSDADEWAEGASSIHLCTGEVNLEEFFENGI